MSDLILIPIYADSDENICEHKCIYGIWMCVVFFFMCCALAFGNPSCSSAEIQERNVMQTKQFKTLAGQFPLWDS